MPIVGTEWIIEAAGCDAGALGQVSRVRAVFDRALEELGLRAVGEGLWHKFPEPGGGVTGLLMLTESHLACHTYPEHALATFNLYCCRERPRWDWEGRLAELLGAKRVSVRRVVRAAPAAPSPTASPLHDSIGAPPATPNEAPPPARESSPRPVPPGGEA